MNNFNIYLSIYFLIGLILSVICNSYYFIMYKIGDDSEEEKEYRAKINYAKDDVFEGNYIKLIMKVTAYLVLFWLPIIFLSIFSKDNK